MRDRSIFSSVVHDGMSLSEHQPAPAVPSITPSVGFLYDSYEQADEALSSHGGTSGQPAFVYARHGAPNAALLEAALSSLEGAVDSIVFSSGMAALHATFTSLLPPGGKVLASSQLYGATRTLLSYIQRTSGISVTYHDFYDLPTDRKIFDHENPDMLICETLTNPLCRVTPIDDVLQIAGENEVISVIDNTFATPYLCRPLELGASLVIHSTTKALNGHGDVLGGVVLSNNQDFLKIIRENRKLLGAMPGAFDSWLTLRGLRTFAIRMRQSCDTAEKIANFLHEHPDVSSVHYPGLQSGEDLSIATRLFSGRGYGSMIAFSLHANTREESVRFINSLQLIRPVTSLGDVYSLISHPASSSHRGLTEAERLREGITEGMLRLSVGIEACEDLIDDLESALKNSKTDRKL